MNESDASAGLQGRGGILVTDFDGTMTRLDFYHLVRERWWQGAARDPWEDYMARRLTHFEALAEFFSKIPVTESEVLAFLDQMELDSSLSATCARLQGAGWSVVIASAGCAWYIEQLLQRAGVKLAVHANPGRFESGRGLLMSLPTESPFFHAQNGIDKVAVVKDALSRSTRVAFAGDGPPDLQPALLVPAELRFARGWLADRLHQDGHGFHAFDRWSDIASLLLKTPTL